MINKLAISRAVQKVIDLNPKDFVFSYEGENVFREKDGSISSMTIHGIYADESSAVYINSSSSDSGTVLKTSQPIILCMWNEANESLPKDATVKINNTNYKVVALENIMQMNIAIQVSLEVI